MPATREAAVAAYVAFYENLTAARLEQLPALCHPQVRFRDPFNDVTGVRAYQAVLARMFRDVGAPRFTVRDRALSGMVAYLRWDFSCTRRRGGAPWQIEGMSEVHFNPAGLVTAHLDHWDSGRQFYGRLPVLRHIVRGIVRRMAADRA